MANYKELEGFGVQTLATDPTEPGSVGQIFYNSTSGTFKTVKPGGVTAGTWASGTALNTGRESPNGGGTSQSSVTVAGGYDGTAIVTNTESYNGSSWTELNDLATARRTGGQAGTTTSALLATGTNTSATEEFSYTATTQIVG